MAPGHPFDPDLLDSVIKAYDVRGIVPDQFTPALATAIGAAFVEVLKIRGAEIQQATAELLADVAGPMIAPTSAIRAAYEGDFPTELEETLGIIPHYFNSRAATIYGGSNEIQRNIIAKGVLGL